MPPKKTASKKSTVSPKGKITGFFAPKPSPKVTKRRQTDDVMTDLPPAKRSHNDDNSLTEEQHDQVAQKKLEAETKLLSKTLGVDNLDSSWVKAIYLEFKKPYFTELWSFVEAERKAHTVYPPVKDVFTWMTACPITEIKVVILGQDPYHGQRQAHGWCLYLAQANKVVGLTGLCFSVPIGTAAPPSLVNMYKELQSDIEGFKIPDHGYLIGWAKQGVLLLNACLTVRAHQANSHQGKGWEKLTDAVIKWINDHLRNVVFLLWGSHAQKKGSAIDKKKHHVLKTVHPSPLSAHRGFFGCKHFLEANRLLQECGKKPIDWAYLPRTLD